jgi:NADPH-dependent F420 reductase
MKIAVIGTGHVGGALGIGWARAGHEVTFGARDSTHSDVAELVAQTGGKAKVSSIGDAAAVAEVVALAVPWGAVADVLQEIQAALAQKLLIDCTNPATTFPAVDHSAGSGGEQVAGLAKGARVVKAFKTTGFENMFDPRYGNESVTMFYAGDDSAAKRVVHRLAKDLGFDPVDAGGLQQAHALEVLASFWGTLAYTQKMGRNIGFRLLRRSS